MRRGLTLLVSAVTLLCVTSTLCADGSKPDVDAGKAAGGSEGVTVAESAVTESAVTAPGISAQGATAQGVGYCVIRPGEPASEEIFAEYEGRRFYFCSQSCRLDFLSDPSRFASLTAKGSLASAGRQDADEPTAAAINLDAIGGIDRGYQSSFWGRVGKLINGLGWIAAQVSTRLHLNDPLNAVLVIASLTAILGIATLWRRQRQRIPSRSAVTATIVLGLLLTTAFYAASLRRSLHASQESLRKLSEEHQRIAQSHQEMIDRDALHYATLLNFGSP